LIFYLVISAVFILTTLSCSSEEPVSITITDETHHLGDNVGSEGVEYSSSFEITSTYESGILSITFLFPNDAGQSGPEIDFPPEIQINDQKVGLFPSDFPDNPDCINNFREYDCDVTISIEIADKIEMRNNTIRIISKGEAHEGDDDFVFTDLKIELK